MASGPSTHPAPGHHPALEALEHAPLDDEPVTEEDERAIEEAREAVRTGDVISDEEFRRRFGL